MLASLTTATANDACKTAAISSPKNRKIYRKFIQNYRRQFSSRRRRYSHLFTKLGVNKPTNKLRLARTIQKVIRRRRTCLFLRRHRHMTPTKAARRVRTKTTRTAPEANRSGVGREPPADCSVSTHHTTTALLHHINTSRHRHDADDIYWAGCRG